MLNEKRKKAKVVSFEIFMSGISIYGISMVVMQLCCSVISTSSPA